MARKFKQSTARNIDVFMVDAGDHITGKTGLTLTIKTSKAGAAFATITPTVTELESGWYNLALTSGMVDTLGDLAFHVTSDGADPSDWLDEVIAFDIYDADPSVDVTKWSGTAVATPTTAGVPEVDVTHWLGTAAATPTVAGVPEVDATHFRGEAIPATSATGVPFVAPQDGSITQAKFGAATGSGARGAFALLGGILWNSSVSAVTSTTITLPATSDGGVGDEAPAFDDALIGATAVITTLNATTDSCHHETRYITDYVASTRVITLDRALANTTNVTWVTIYAGNGRAAVDVGKWLGTVPATPAIAGVPRVDVTHFAGDEATVVNAGVPTVDVTHWFGTTVDTPDSPGIPNVNVLEWRGQTVAGINGSGEFTSASFATGFITSTKFASGAIDAAAIATNAIGSDELATSAVSEIVDGVWGASPASYTSSSQIGFYVLKVLQPLLTRTATAAAGGASTVTLDGSASASDDFYNGGLVIIASGTGAGQFRTISDYVGFTKVATVDRAWTTNPDNTSVFVILGAAAAQVTGTVNAAVVSIATDAISAASVSAAAAEKIRDSLLDYAYRSGRTVRGLFRRLGASLEVATGLLGSTATFKQPDGTTTEYSVTQDVANGARTAVDVTNSETP